MRYRREEQYVLTIAELAREGPYSHEVGVHMDFLFDPEVPVLSQRTQAAHWGQHDDLDPQWSMPKPMRQYETRQRHRLELYIPAFCVEANWMSPGHQHRVYVPFAAWWPAYELPYGLRAELPKFLAYFSRRLVSDPEDVMWFVFLTDWVAECLKEALLAARGGRLWWLPTRVRADLDELGVDNVLYACRPQMRDDARALLRYIETVDCSRCPLHHRYLPEVAKRCSPVYADSGDFFKFDAAQWRPIDAPLRPARGDEDAPPTDEDERGPRVYGRTVGRLTWACPSGYPRGRGAAYPSVRQRETGQAALLIERASSRGWGRDATRGGRIGIRRWSGPRGGRRRGHDCLDGVDSGHRRWCKP